MSVPIEFRDVTLPPLKNFSASAPAGVIIGLVGDAGSGVNQLLDLVNGVMEPDRGEVLGSHAFALPRPIEVHGPLERARELLDLEKARREGDTILAPSHDSAFLETVCDEVWWIDGGRLALKGDPKETLAKYRQHVVECVRSWGDTIPSRLSPSLRKGDGRAEIVSIETLGADGSPTICWKSGEDVSVRAVVRFHETVNEPVFGLMIRTQIGFEVYGTNTELEQVKTGTCAPSEVRTITFAFRCDLCPRAYTVTLASHDADGTAHDWLDNAVAVTVVDHRYTAGVANLRAKVSVSNG
jgi:ABC-type methionine transport system ATPase subunit